MHTQHHEKVGSSAGHDEDDDGGCLNGCVVEQIVRMVDRWGRWKRVVEE